MLSLKKFLIFSSLFIVSYCNLNTDVDVYSVEHSIDTNNFKEIASLNIRIIRQNQNQAQFQSYNSINDKLHESDQPKFHDIQHSTPIETNLIDESTKTEIRNALEVSNTSFYRLRLCKKVPEPDCSVASFIYLKHVEDSNYLINLTVNIGLNNRMSSISIKTRPKKDISEEMNLNSLEHMTFYTSIQSMKQGQIPETEAYLEKAKKEIEQKEIAAGGGNESFLQKYWMYIVPFVVIMFLMNLVNPEAGG
jgi:hypothetical protein